MDTLPGPSPSPPPSPGRTYFHVALASIFLPPVGPILTLLLALQSCVHRNRTDEDRRWTSRLFALFFADLVVVSCLVASYRSAPAPEGLSRPVAKIRPSAREQVSPPRIGVSFEPNNPEPRFRQVVPGSPADRAGLKAGDLVLKIDGAKIRTQDELRESISKGEKGVSRRLEISRNGMSLEVDVIPEIQQSIFGKRGLMETSELKAKMPWLGMVLSWLFPLVVVGGASRIAAQRRGAPKIVVWRAVALALGASMAGAAGALLAARAIMGGWSLFGLVMAMNMQVLALLAVAALSLRRLSPLPPPEGPFLPPWRAMALAVLYLVTGYLRLAIVLFGVVQLLKVDRPAETIKALTQAMPGIVGLLMIVIDVVLLGPIAEELLFRGILLPRLAAQLGGKWALWASAILFASLHFQYGLFMVLVLYYGLILGWARLRTGGLRIPILLHVLINGFTMATFLISR